MATNSIDIVYTWVNGNDPVWYKKKEEELKKQKIVYKKNNSDSRYIDNNELLYSLRSLEKYAPWIGNIYIVTDNQIPEWLNLESKKIKVVNHKNIIPKKLLPTFNSNLIEWYIGCIENLSEQFVYFCDDFMVCNTITQEALFTKNKLPIYSIYPTYKNNGAFNKKNINEIISKRTIENSMYGLPHYDNSFEIVEQYIGNKIPRFFLKHAPIPINKAQLNALRIENEDLIYQMAKYKFRSTKDISSQYMMAALNYSNGMCVCIDSDERVFEFVTNKGHEQPVEMLEEIFNDNHKFISIATGDDFDMDRVLAANKMLNIKFNARSSFEKRRNDKDWIIMKGKNVSSIRNFFKFNIRSRFKKEYSKEFLSDEELISKSNLFDPDYYLKNNKDLATTGIDALDHFIRYGDAEGRSPSAKFNSELYKIMHPEIHNRGEKVLLYYLRHNKNSIVHNDQSYGEKAVSKYKKNIDKKLIASFSETKRTIIMYSMAWDGQLQQRPHHLAKLLAKKNTTVLYIDSHITIPKKIKKNCFVYPNHEIIELLDRKQGEIYYWLFSTTEKKLKELKKLKQSGIKIIYDYIDDIHESITKNIHIQIENFNNLDLLDPVILVASAKKLHDQLLVRFPSAKVVIAQNAVDIEHFNIYQLNNNEIPTDMAEVLNTGKKIVGYYGAIAPWLDYKLLNKLSANRKDYIFVYIGVDYNGGLKNLIMRDNVIFLGQKQYGELPNYSKMFDCAIIPFENGDIAKSTSPVKLFEYMAMGLPTVCTKDLVECKGYEYVYVSNDEYDFEKNIDIAINNKSDKRIVDLLYKQAQKNTWQKRVDTIFAAIIKTEGSIK